MTNISRRELLRKSPLYVGAAVSIATFPSMTLGENSSEREICLEDEPGSECLDRFLTELANQRAITRSIKRNLSQLPTLPDLPDKPSMQRGAIIPPRPSPLKFPTHSLTRLSIGDSSLIDAATRLGESYLSQNSRRDRVRHDNFLGQIQETLKYEDYIESHRDDVLVDLCKGLIIAESGADIRATSYHWRTRKPLAKGLTQLIEPTAEKFGLRVDGKIDERIHPERSIYGGFEYLNALLDLYNGDHRLALTAYNGGPLRASYILKEGLRNAQWETIRNHKIKKIRGREGEPLLREETQDYVPKVLGLGWAIAKLKLNNKIPKPDILYSEFIGYNSNSYKMDSGESLRYVSTRERIPLENLQEFNPHVVNPNADIGGETIRVPIA